MVKGPHLLLAAMAWCAIANPAHAETYYHYECAGGTHFDLAVFASTNAAFLQIDGKSIRLPKSISVTGTRYRGSGITVWVKGNRATLRRAGKRTECKAQ